MIIQQFLYIYNGIAEDDFRRIRKNVGCQCEFKTRQAIYV